MQTCNSVKKLALGLAFSGLFAWQANAIVAYNTPSTTLENQTAGPYALGEAFTVNNSAGISITALGLYDGGTAGISGSVQVGIYNITGGINSAVLVGSTFTFSGTSSALLSGSAYRFQSVTPFLLTAGSTYEIVAFGVNGTANPGYNDQTASPSLINLDSGNGAISFGGNYYNVNPALTPNTLDVNPTGMPGRYGAGSFEFTPVPEASTFAFAGIGMLGLIYAGRTYALKLKFI